jgi:hypothetical protein
MSNYCLATVRFRPGAQSYTYKTDLGTQVGDKISVYSWVSQSRVSLLVEEIKPMDDKTAYTYARKD